MKKSQIIARIVYCLFLVVGIAVGIAILIFADEVSHFYVSDGSYGSYHPEVAFGGDYYTYSYEVLCDIKSNVSLTAERVGEAANLIANAIGYLLLAIGLIDIAYFTSKLASSFIHFQVISTEPSNETAEDPENEQNA